VTPQPYQAFLVGYMHHPMAVDLQCPQVCHFGSVADSSSLSYPRQSIFSYLMNAYPLKPVFVDEIDGKRTCRASQSRFCQIKYIRSIWPCCYGSVAPHNTVPEETTMKTCVHSRRVQSIVQACEFSLLTRRRVVFEERGYMAWS
jgi:hypothetical protein